jgi:peptidase family M50|nr:site-2 protease family protein [uncultured Ruminococcus sp.]
MKFELFNIKFSVSYTLLCLIAVCIILDIFGGFVMCSFAVVIHESGHLLMMLIFGSKPKKIRISLFEIAINDESRQQRGDLQNFLIVFFGPFANFICFIIIFLIYLCSGTDLLKFAYVNLSLCLLNLLPVMSFDGGQLLYILLSRRFTGHTAEKTVNIITFIALFPIAVLGFIILFNSDYNFSLLFVCGYIILSLIFKNNRYF